MSRSSTISCLIVNCPRFADAASCSHKYPRQTHTRAEERHPQRSEPQPPGQNNARVCGDLGSSRPRVAGLQDWSTVRMQHSVSVCVSQSVCLRQSQVCLHPAAQLTRMSLTSPASRSPLILISCSVLTCSPPLSRTVTIHQHRCESHQRQRQHQHRHPEGIILTVILITTTAPPPPQQTIDGNFNGRSERGRGRTMRSSQQWFCMRLSLRPMIPFSGVRSSCEIAAKNWEFHTLRQYRASRSARLGA
eukprot:481283-Rhodomonas_salina.1